MSVWNEMGKHSLNKALRSTDTGVRGVTHPSFVVAVVLEKAAEITTKTKEEKGNKNVQRDHRKY